MATIVLSGGNTRIKGFCERLKDELCYKYKKKKEISEVIKVYTP